MFVQQLPMPPGCNCRLIEYVSEAAKLVPPTGLTASSVGNCLQVCTWLAFWQRRGGGDADVLFRGTGCESPGGEVSEGGDGQNKDAGPVRA